MTIRQVAIPLALEDLPRPNPHFDVRRLAGRTMGTTWSVSCSCSPTVDLAAIRASLETCLDLVVKQMSTWHEMSDLGRFNRSEQEWQRLPNAFMRVLVCALDVARDSGGAYDPTIGPLVDLWGFGPAGTRTSPPPDHEIARARRRCGWQQIEIDTARSRARQPGGVSIDLSSIAKGFAVDLVCGALDDHGVESYLVEIGGELRGRGAKPDGQPWWVAVEPPPPPSEALSPEPRPFDLLIALHGLAVATSGDYRAGFHSGGSWYSHTIDPRSGYPVDRQLASVTVLDRHCLEADAWSTALFVLGANEGVRLAEDRDIAALFVSRGPTGLTQQTTPVLDKFLRV